MKVKVLVLGVSISCLFLAGCAKNYFKPSASTQSAVGAKTPVPAPSVKTPEPVADKKVVVKTAKGEFEIALYSSLAPKSVENFIKKANENFYKGLKFHRVEDWVVQGGDPDGNGTGGGSQPTELSGKEFKEGSVGVARAGEISVSNDSQFFICIKDCAWLTRQYTYLGEVTSGLEEVVKKIKRGDKIESISVK